MEVPDGVFAKLIKHVDRLSPVAFTLPDQIKSFFSGGNIIYLTMFMLFKVQWDNQTGDYVDLMECKSPRQYARGCQASLTLTEGRIMGPRRFRWK